MRKPELEKQMFSHIQKWEQTSLSQKDYCKEQGIKMHIFSYWLDKYRKQFSKNNDFVQINGLNTKGDIHLHFPNGVELILPDHTPVEYLKSLIKI